MMDLLVEDDVYAFARVTDRERAVVVFHNGAKDVTLQIPVSDAGVAEGATLRDAYGTASPAQVQNGVLPVRLGPKTVAIYR